MPVVLLIVGYLAAVPLLPFLRRILREGNYRLAALESLGALSITGGWLLRGRTTGVLINGGWLLVWTAIWLWRYLRRS